MTVAKIDTYAHTVGSTVIAVNTFLFNVEGKSPASDVAAYLDNFLIGVLPDGTNSSETVYIYETHEPSNISLTTPTVTVYDSGGFDSLIGEDFKNHQPTVQVIVASGQGFHDEAENKAYQIKRLMQQPLVFVAGDMRYYGAYVQGDVNFIGTDDNNVSRYSINIRLYRVGGLSVSSPPLVLIEGGNSAAKDVVEYISNSSLAVIPSGTLDTSTVYVYSVKEPSSRSLLVPTVTVYGSGGFDSVIGEDFKNGQPTVQIVVAGSPSDPKPAYNKALEIKELMQTAVTFTAGVTTYYGSYAQGDINYQGTDDNDVARYSIDIRLYRTES